MSSQQKVIVIGGGPVGALSALRGQKRLSNPNYGDPNARPDIAVIPLALSERGIKAIAGADVPGLLDGILDNSRPIYTRMVHTKDKEGEPKNIPMTYGPQGQCLHTLQREKITKHVMLALMQHPNAKLLFNQRLSSCDLDKKVVVFETVAWKEKSRVAEQQLADDVAGNKPMPVAKPSEDVGASKNQPVNTSEKTTVSFDFLIGADGTYSSVRQSMMRKTHMDFSQEYCEALWCDFVIPAKGDGDYPMNSQCLHVWPADKSIAMCQPDFDGSFRGGMVCDESKIRYYEKHLDEFADFFDNEFPGIIPKMLSREEITKQFAKNQKIPLKSVKCGKLGYKDNAVLLGDSSHAMTPFHAMGMITGLEDVRVFYEDFRDPMWSSMSAAEGKEKPFCAPGTIQAYTQYRLPDVHAMVDMAAEHYYELRHGVRSPANRAKKVVEAKLSRWVPSLNWTTLYARIQFGHERFTVAREKEEKQMRIIKAMMVGILTVIATLTLLGLGKAGKEIAPLVVDTVQENSVLSALDDDTA